MKDLGDVLGVIGLLSVIYLAARPVLQWVVGKLRKQGKTLPNWLKKTNQFVNKTHRYVGFVVMGVIVVHAILQVTQAGEVPTAGLVAGLALAVQLVLGLGLMRQKDKERRKKMALLHRAMGVFIVVAVLVHRLS